MEKTERKIFVATWRKKELEAIDADKNRDFLTEALELTAEQMGIYLISNPGDSVQWISNKLVENKDAETVTLYAEVFVRHEGAEEYLKRNKVQSMEAEDGREEA